MRIHCAALALLLAPGTLLAGPDLSGTISILDETFDGPLNRYDGRSGLWSTLPRRGNLMTNAAETVFIDHGVLGEEADALLPKVHEITPEGLALRTVAIPDDVLPALRDYMKATRQGNQADKIRFGTGEITTAHTWSQTYGYFEIEARIPRGRGRWPAFWLTYAGLGWPPEIDFFEAYGEGIGRPTKKDGRFNTSVHFDARGEGREEIYSTDIENPYADPGTDPKPNERPRGDRSVYTFNKYQDSAEYGADIYSDFHIFAGTWTPEKVTFYFGKDRDSLREIYTAPTAEDVHSPMFLIANDQFTARGGWWPAPEETLEQVLAPENAYMIRRIRVRAFEPELQLDMAAGTSAYDDRDSVILDTPGDDTIAPAAGFDVITLTGGADLIHLQRGKSNKIIRGFDADDRIVFDSYPFVDAEDVMTRLTQVGADVWLPSGADPGWPSTVIFRDRDVADFSADQFESRWPVSLDLWRAEAKRSRRPEFDIDGDGRLTGGPDGSWLNDQGRAIEITGGPGHDRFVIASRESNVVEPSAGSIDRIDTMIPLDLPANVEHGVARRPDALLRGGSGNDRLEAASPRALLQGDEGDDLFVIAPNATSVTIRLRAGDGHDRIRGAASQALLAMGPDLLARRSEWRLTEVPEGTLLTLGEDQSLLIEGLDETAVQAILPATD
ncbi:family 16 glycosylhydrolase [bacterium]|nr:family 16 glycosylhydrolase [bacterium]